MKKIFLLVLSLYCLNETAAQCGAVCTPVFANCLPTGGLCNRADTGMANNPYTFTYQFYMPKKLTDPNTLSQCSGCNYVQLREIKITGIGGLPAGISEYRFSQSQSPYPGYYNVNAGDTMGCVTICGTPLAPGMYPIQVYITAEVTAIGTPIGNVDATSTQVYADTLYIKPDTSGSVSSFTYGGVKEDCDSVGVTLNAVIEAQAPNPTAWTWNINGQISNQKSPGSYAYTQPGTYDISLQTTMYQFKVKRVRVNSTGSWYRGDIEESVFGDPELYVKVGLLGINSRGGASGTSITINVPDSIPLIPIGTTSLSFEVWEEDNGPPLGSDDDFGGTFSVPISQGASYPLQIPFSGTNANGWVEIDTVGSTTIIDTLHVTVKGSQPVPQILVARDSICKGDTIQLTASPYCADCIYIWHKDTITFTGINDSVLYASESGLYWLWVSNQVTGCTNQNDSALLLHTVNQPLSQTIVYNPTNGKLYPVTSTSGYSVKWYKDGVELVGQTGSSITPTESGLYKIEVYNAAFPECSAEAELFVNPQSSVGIDGIDEALSINVFPNPNSGKFKVVISGVVAQESEIRISDMIGRTVYYGRMDITSDRSEKEIDLTDAHNGVYLLSIELNGKHIVRKVVVE